MQHLFRLEIRTSDEHDNVRLTLKLWRPDRFELAVVDPIGRQAGILMVSERDGRWRSRREEESCRFDASTSVVFDGVALDLPADLLPRLLLGQPPVALPGGDAAPEPGTTTVRRVAGPEGGSWEIHLSAGQTASWTLQRPGQPSLIWRALPSGASLTSADGALELKWRETARGLLPGEPPSWPALDDEPECGRAPVP